MSIRRVDLAAVGAVGGARNIATLAVLLLTACPPAGGTETMATTDDATTSSGSTGGVSTTGSTGAEPTSGTTGPDVTTGPDDTGTSGTTGPDETSTGEPGSTGAPGSTGEPGSTGAPDPVCGDGNVDEGEECDVVNDNALGDGDGCTAMCVKECTALRFAGETVVTAAEPAALSVTSVTLAAWHKAAPDAPHGVVAAKRGAPPGGHFTYQIVAGAGGVTARLQTALNIDTLDLAAPMELPDGAWHHLALTYDEATGEGVLYRDGVEIASGTKGTGLVAADPNEPFTIGAITLNGGLNVKSKADIADVVVYDAALGPAEVMALSQGIYPAGPLAFYPVHEGTGTMSADASGNGHTLTVPADGWVADGPFCM